MTFIYRPYKILVALAVALIAILELTSTDCSQAIAADTKPSHTGPVLASAWIS